MNPSQSNKKIKRSHKDNYSVITHDLITHALDNPNPHSSSSSGNSSSSSCSNSSSSNDINSSSNEITKNILLNTKNIDKDFSEFEKYMSLRIVDMRMVGRRVRVTAADNEYR
jgi:hypothetical protein